MLGFSACRCVRARQGCVSMHGMGTLTMALERANRASSKTTSLVTISYGAIKATSNQNTSTHVYDNISRGQ